LHFWKQEMTQLPQYVPISQLASTPTKSGMLPVSKPTIWRWVSEGHFPAPIKFEPKVTARRLVDVQAFMSAQAGGM
jgi:predicted DNA-binding transcriptional regulator AlpA